MNTTARDRLRQTLNHEQPEQVVVDLGSTPVTGIAATTLTQLRRALGLPGKLVKVHEPYQMLGLVEEDVRQALGLDVVGVIPRATLFGFPLGNWKPFTLFDGTEVLVPEGFNVSEAPGGGWYIYPQGDVAVPPSGHMPAGGYYFDSVPRQEPIRDDQLDPADNWEEFAVIGPEDIAHFRAQAEAAHQRGLGAVLTVPGASFGDVALVPAPWLKNPRGIRDVEEWYVSLAARRPYVRSVFEKQCEIALRNIELLVEAVGDKVQVAFTSGTDFGHQHGLLCGVEAYRELYQPFHRALNDYIHAHTDWKVFIHTCGAIFDLVPALIESGFDIVNPAQCSAADMDPRRLKAEFGKDIVFWGGGVDTQQTLPFGTPEQVYREVRERIDIFNEGGGFVFDAIHNIQAQVPVENLMALWRAVADARG